MILWWKTQRFRMAFAEALILGYGGVTEGGEGGEHT